MPSKEGLRKSAGSTAGREDAAGPLPTWVNRLASQWWGAAVLAFTGAILMWLAQPPLAWWPAGWIALVSWMLMAGTPRQLWHRGYTWLYLAALAYWLMTLQGLRHAHPAMFLGWFALSLYLAVYPPLAVALVRVGHRRNLPLPLLVATVWTGLELIRGYAFTGVSLVLLGHSQVDNATVVQIADTFGTFGVTFLLAYVSGAIADALLRSASWSWSGWVKTTVAPVLLVAASLTYGDWRMRQAENVRAEREPLGRIMLVQRNEPVEYVMSRERHAEIFRSYLQGTLEALRSIEGPPVDLVVWPESMYSGGFPLMLIGDDPQVPEGVSMTRPQLLQTLRVQVESFRQQAAEIQQQLRAAQGYSTAPAMLVGCGVLRFDEREEHYSGAVLIGPEGDVASWYGKRHLVMFGEYVPFAGWLPWLYRVLPISHGVTPGPETVSMEVDDFIVVPNICFETVVEHVTIRQVRDLLDRQISPDVIVNITNDAWFGESSLLDHHRRCSQIVAIGCRRPLLMAANVGPTVWINGSGQLAESLPPGTDGSILARPVRDGRWGLYQAIGDWPARLLAVVCVLLAMAGLRERRRQRRQRVGLAEDAPAPADS